MAVEYRCDKCGEVVDINGSYTDEDGDEYESTCYIHLDAQNSEDQRMLCIDCWNEVVEFIDDNLTALKGIDNE